MKNKKYFFGWQNIRWGIKELIKTLSNENSYFSKKRIESFIGFAVAEWGMIYFLILHIKNLTASDMFIWAGIQFAVAGYVVNQIQKEKKLEIINKSEKIEDAL